MTTVLGPDVYHGNIDRVPAARIADDPRFGFVILKATEGTSYSWAKSWLPQNWSALGDTRLARGAYHYLLFAKSGKEQAEFYLESVDAAGGFGDGDLHPIFDAEWKLNEGVGKDAILDCISDFITVIRAEGHKVIRYGRTLFNDLHITTDTGADFAWIPRYNNELEPEDHVGFAEADLWQYTNGRYNFTPWPNAAPGMRPGDVSVVLTDLARLTRSGVAPADLREANIPAAPHRPTPSTWSDKDWEAFADHLPLPTEEEQKVQEFVLGQMDRRFARPEPAEQGPRRAGWRHEDDVIAIRKSIE